MSSPKYSQDSFNDKIYDIISRSNKDYINHQNSIKVANAVNPRLALRNSLIAKQYRVANDWLARELGYKCQEDHIQDCKKAEDIKIRNSIKKGENQFLKYTLSS